MEPFKVSNPLRSITGAYPEASTLSQAAKQGGESTRTAIARLWLSEGIPYAFKDCPGIYESVRTWIAMRLDVDPKEINLTGSARLGQSLAPHKMGKLFGEGSDLDMFIISSELFDKLKTDFNNWSDDYESKVVVASNERENGFWRDNFYRGAKNISKGFIDAKLIPNREKYSHARNVAQTMFLLKEKLGTTDLAPTICHASLRCYKSWSSCVNQISLSLPK